MADDNKKDKPVNKILDRVNNRPISDYYRDQMSHGLQTMAQHSLRQSVSAIDQRLANHKTTVSNIDDQMRHLTSRRKLDQERMADLAMKGQTRSFEETYGYEPLTDSEYFDQLGYISSQKQTMVEDFPADQLMQKRRSLQSRIARDRKKVAYGSASALDRRISAHFGERESASRMKKMRDHSAAAGAINQISHEHETFELEDRADQARTAHEALVGIQRDLAGQLPRVGKKRRKKILAEIDQYQAQAYEAEEHIAMYEGGLRRQRSQKRDIVSEVEQAQIFADRILGEHSQQQKIQKYQEDFGESLENPFEKLKEVSEELQESLVKAAKAAEEFTKVQAESPTDKAAIREARARKEETQMSARDAELRKHALEGIIGSDQQRRENFFQGMRGVSQVLGGASDMTRYFGIDLPSRRDQTQAGVAGVLSRQYSDMESMFTQGDVRARRRLDESYETAAEDFAGGAAAGDISSGLGGLAGFAMAAGSIGLTAASFFPPTAAAARGTRYAMMGARALGLGTRGARLARGGMQAAGGALRSGMGRAVMIGAGLSGITSGIRGVSEIAAGTAAGSGGLTRFEASMQREDATRFISEEQLQAGVNLTRGMAAETSGFGAAGNQLFDDFVTDEGFREASMRAGMTRDMRSAFMQQARVSLGVDATRGHALQAARMQTAGIMSAAEATMLQGQLTTVGGGTDDMSSILREAVAAGMDDSKSISAMVDATTRVAEASIMSTGYSTVQGAQMMVSRAAGALDPSISAAARARIAARAADRVSDITSDTGYNIQNLVQMSQMRSMFGEHGIDLNARELRTFQSISLEEFNQMMLDGEEGVREFFEDSGLSKIARHANVMDMVTTGRNIQVGQGVIGLAGGVEFDEARIRAGVERGIQAGTAFDQLDQEYRNFMLQVGREEGTSGRALYEAMVFDKAEQEVSELDRQKLSGQLGAITGEGLMSQTARDNIQAALDDFDPETQAQIQRRTVFGAQSAFELGQEGAGVEGGALDFMPDVAARDASADAQAQMGRIQEEFSESIRQLPEAIRQMSESLGGASNKLSSSGTELSGSAKALIDAATSLKNISKTKN